MTLFNGVVTIYLILEHEVGVEEEADVQQAQSPTTVISI